MIVKSKLHKKDAIPPDTERLTFRLLNQSDVEEWKKFVLSEEAMKFFTLPREEEQNKIWIDKQLKRYEDGLGGLLAVCSKEDGSFFGQCGLLYQELEGQFHWEVGYSFLPEYWGNGYASEAALACFNHGFNLNLADYLLSIIHEDNIESQMVAKRCGLSIWKKTTWKDFPVQVWRKNPNQSNQQ